MNLTEKDVGRRFVRRDGEIVTGQAYDPDGEEGFLFCAGDEWYYESGSFYGSVEYPYDLIRRLPEEPALTREQIALLVQSEGGTVTWPEPLYDEEREVWARIEEANLSPIAASFIREGRLDHRLPTIAKILQEWKEKHG